jgi:hypothetical protein
MFNKENFRSYGYFPCILNLIFWGKWFLQLCPKLPSFVQKPQEILGVNIKAKLKFQSLVWYDIEQNHLTNIKAKLKLQLLVWYDIEQNHLTSEIHHNYSCSFDMTLISVGKIIFTFILWLFLWYYFNISF